MTTEPDSEWMDIKIAGPLSLNMAGTLMTAIGTLWPEAVAITDSHYALHMQVPKVPAKSLDEEFVEQLSKSNVVDDNDAEFLGFRDGWVAFAPPEELCLHLGEVAHSIMQGYPKEIVNHLEWTVRTGKDPDDPSYVLSISRSQEQTPLAMRKAAEAENERLLALLEKHGIDPDEKP